MRPPSRLRSGRRGELLKVIKCRALPLVSKRQRDQWCARHPVTIPAYSTTVSKRYGGRNEAKQRANFVAHLTGKVRRLG